MRSSSHTALPASRAGAKCTRGSIAFALASRFALVSAGSEIELGSTRPVESTTNCIHDVPVNSAHVPGWES